MTAAQNTVVSIQYILKVEGEVVDEGQLAYLHGHGNIVQGLERALDGLPVGAMLSVEVPPSEGYGDYDPDGQMVVERGAFPPDVEVVPGAQFYAENEEGQPLPIVVLDVNGDEVTVDSNHPLAGATLHFDVEITRIRWATETEIEHGHAHEGNHHHH